MWILILRCLAILSFVLAAEGIKCFICSSTGNTLQDTCSNDAFDHNSVSQMECSHGCALTVMFNNGEKQALFRKCAEERAKEDGCQEYEEVTLKRQSCFCSNQDLCNGPSLRLTPAPARTTTEGYGPKLTCFSCSWGKSNGMVGGFEYCKEDQFDSMSSETTECRGLCLTEISTNDDNSIENIHRKCSQESSEPVCKTENNDNLTVRKCFCDTDFCNNSCRFFSTNVLILLIVSFLFCFIMGRRLS